MPVPTAERAVIFTAGVFIGLAAGLPIGLAISEPKRDLTVPATADAATDPASFALYRSIVTGVDPAEDDPAFDCRIHGNRICGPNNDQGVPPGEYRDAAPGTTLATFMLGGGQ